MRKLVASLFVSLDGVIDAPQRWNMPYFDEEMGQVVEEEVATADAFLLGRVTYQEWAAFWPHQPSEMPLADVINERPKHVVTNTLDTLEWRNSSVISGDVAAAVRRLKGGPGKNIAVIGSGTLMRFLLQQGLVDELHLMTFPVVAGTGKRLLEGAGTQMPLQLTSSRVFSTGVVYAVYQPTAGA